MNNLNVYVWLLKSIFYLTTRVSYRLRVSSTGRSVLRKNPLVQGSQTVLPYFTNETKTVAYNCRLQFAESSGDVIFPPPQPLSTIIGLPLVSFLPSSSPRMYFILLRYRVLT